MAAVVCKEGREREGGVFTYRCGDWRGRRRWPTLPRLGPGARSAPRGRSLSYACGVGVCWWVGVGGGKGTK